MCESLTTCLSTPSDRAVLSAIQIANPNGGQNDQIGFAKRANPRSIVGPVVGGVVGGVAGIAIIALAVFFCIRRRNRKKLRDAPDSEDEGGNVGRFVEDKDTRLFPFAAQPTNALPTSPTSPSYTSAPQTPHTPRFVEAVPQQSHDVNDPPSFSPYDLVDSGSPSRQQQPNPFPGHGRKN